MRKRLATSVICALAALTGIADAAEPAKSVPPSPSSVPGERIWPDPSFTHWPAVAYPDESRNVAFALPNRVPGQNGHIGWNGGEAMPIAMPDEGDRASGLLPLSLAPGRREAAVELGAQKSTLALRVVDAREPWPLAALRDGFPVDDKGVPVVLVDRRRRADEERKWGPLRGSATRPDGRALIVGDPLEALGENAWNGLDAETRPALDERYPHHAVLVALARLDHPRTIIWCPGNQALFGAAWSSEEERILGVVRTRCEALGIQPRLVLAAPPVPLDEPLRAQAAERRDLLIKSATVQGWMVLDLERIAGAAEQANQVREGLFTRYPTGEAQARIRQALRDELGH